ncbi:MAG: hypothetical protein K2Z80_23895 [Xanthobacteraceae bacterium]|nr:hypothetical protein [Xanthobacteraceae bacterium]
MLDWTAEKVIAIVSYVPAQFVPPDSQHFTVIRSMFAVLLIVLVLLILALHPLRSIRRYMRNRQSAGHRADR